MSRKTGLRRGEGSIRLVLDADSIYAPFREEELADSSGVRLLMRESPHHPEPLLGIRFPASWSNEACWSWAIDNAGSELAAVMPAPIWKIGQAIAILGWEPCGERAETVILPSSVHATLETVEDLVVLRSLHFPVSGPDGFIKARQWARSRGLEGVTSRMRSAA
jgi:hypothetical protein